MTKSERLGMVIEILTSQMNHWLFFPLVMTFMGLSRLLVGKSDAGKPDFILWAICGLFPLASFLVRYYVENLGLFFLYHGTLVACSLVLPVSSGGVGRAVCVLCAVVYMVYSPILRLGNHSTVYSSPIHPGAAVAVSVVANFFLHRHEGAPASWDRYYFYTLIGVFACYLLIYYLRQYVKFIKMNESSTGYLPAGEILRSGIGFVLPYTLFGVVLLTLSLNVEWLEPILGMLKAAGIAVLTFLFGYPLRGRIEESVTESDVGYAPESGMMELFPGESLWFWEALENMVIFLFVCAASFCIIKVISMFLKLIKDRFGWMEPQEDLLAAEGVVCDIHEQCDAVRKDPDAKGQGIFHRFTPAERIRRMFKRRVLSGKIEVKDRSELNYMTAKECGSMLSLPDMAEIYEQARYSGRTVTAEDVKEMKAACEGK